MNNDWFGGDWWENSQAWYQGDWWGNALLSESDWTSVTDSNTETWTEVT